MAENIEKYGSFVGSRKDGKYSFTGLSSDVGSLPETIRIGSEGNALGSGSTAYCVDTGELYMYEASSKKWYKQ